MNTCKYCGKPLTLTPEYDICMECQGRIMRESTIPQGAFATNSTHPQMITHEEAREIALAMLPKQVGSKSSQNKVRNYFQLDLYFKQQELKELRATKEHELLELYKLRDNYQSHTSEYQKIQKGIKVLEKELEELK